MHVLIPLIAAFIFALGSIFTKRAYAEGARIPHAFFLNCLLLGIVFQPFLLASEGPIDWARVHQPVMVGTLFFLGHLIHFLAIRAGDVSVVTPLLGSKTVFVAMVAALGFGIPLGSAQWGAALLTTFGVLLMGRTDAQPGRRRGLAVLLALLCALSFALCDVLIQRWAADFGIHNFLPLAFAAVAAEALLALPAIGLSAFAWPSRARKWLFLGAAFTAVQGILVSASVAHFRDATGVNVVYGTRGLWGIALVWIVGRRLGNREREEAGGKALALRLAGAVAILAGVVLVVTAGSSVAR